MSKFRKSEPEDDGKVFSPNCHAHGCPLRGTVDYGNSGRFFCTAHANTGPQQWSLITTAIREHLYLAQLIGDLQRMANAGEDWAKFATDYWTGYDEAMVPNPDERRNPSAYLYRLLGEFQYRIGRRKGKPEAWTDPNRAKPKPRNSAAAFLQTEPEAA